MNARIDASVKCRRGIEEKMPDISRSELEILVENWTCLNDHLEKIWKINSNILMEEKSWKTWKSNQKIVMNENLVRRQVQGNLSHFWYSQDKIRMHR